MSALIDAWALAGELASPELVVLDATVELPPPAHDGDYRATSGLQGFRQGHIPGAHHADLLGVLARPGAGCHFAQPRPGALANRRSTPISRW